MDIILSREKTGQRFDCLLKRNSGVANGQAATGLSEEANHTILIGTSPADSDDFEADFSDALHAAFTTVLTNRWTDVAIDVDSFVSNPSFAPYTLNAILDCLLECRFSDPGSKLTVYMMHTALQMEKALQQELEDAIFKPVKEIENQSFGDDDDPLKEEFQNFRTRLPKQKPFRGYLLELIDKKNFRKYSEAYKKCGISKSTFSKIANFTLEDYKPSKSTVAAFAIGLELNIDEAQTLFHSAGYHLGNAEPMDQILRFFIAKKIYDLQEVNACLYYYDIPILGEHVRDDCVRMTRDATD